MISLITGANSGIGLETAFGLAKAGHTLIITARDQAKADEALAAIRARHPGVQAEEYLFDLADIKQVVQVAAQIKAKYPVLDRLVCNAGYIPDDIQYVGPGYERSFVANHLGHFALASVLLPSLQASEESRVVAVSSGLHPSGKASRFFAKNQKISSSSAYGDGKLANILFAQELARRCADTSLTAYSLHPGVVRTNFGSNMGGFVKAALSVGKYFMISPAEGAQTSIYLATVPLPVLAGHNGAYFDKRKPAATRNDDITPGNAKALWQASELAMAELLG